MAGVNLAPAYVSTADSSRPVLIIISANTEWRAVQEIYPGIEQIAYPFGAYFCLSPHTCYPDESRQVIFIHGGWGKISAAASAQWAIDAFRPGLVINLGTCGGFSGEVQRGDIILVEKTIVYDIIEQMGDFAAHIAHYATEIDLSWLEPPYPLTVIRTLLVSGDRDLLVDEIPELKARYDAVAGDWESSAIAWVSAHNHRPCLILRGVTDLVGPGGGEAYDGNEAVFHENAARVMAKLVASLPGWLSKAPA